MKRNIIITLILVTILIIWILIRSTTNIQTTSEIPNDWITYKSVSNGFHFNYPPDWILKTYYSDEKEIVQLFSKQPEKESNIYLCINIRKYDGSDPNKNSSIIDSFITQDGSRLSLLERKDTNTTSTNNFWRLVSAGERSIKLPNNNEFGLFVTFNCVGGDDIVLYEQDDFIFYDRQEIIIAKQIIKSFGF